MPVSAPIPGYTDGGDKMLLIPCPHCGARDESEFDYGGRAMSYPELNASLADWHEVLHLPDHCLNEIEELWYHSCGCECWIKVTRNLVTHEFPVVRTETGEIMS